MTVKIVTADWRDGMASLDNECGQMILTSPPYYGLRDYGVAGQLGLEQTPEEYIANLVVGFRDAKRLIPKDGTLWVNIGDSYANDSKWGGSSGGKHVKALHGKSGIGRGRKFTGLKSKDLIGIPYMLAFALRADGWYWRKPIVWAKPNGMPESVTDRPSSSYEIILLMAKSPKYFYNNRAVRRPLAPSSVDRFQQPGFDEQAGSTRADGQTRTDRPMKPVRFGGTKYAGNDRDEGSENAGNLGARRDEERANARLGANGGGLLSRKDREEKRERERERESRRTDLLWPRVAPVRERSLRGPTSAMSGGSQLSPTKRRTSP